MAYTTICVKPETKKLLQEIGVKRETYDEIIQRLVREAGWKKLDERWNRILEEDEFISLDEL